MKKITFLAALFFTAAVTLQAQHVLFEDDFESYEDFAIADVGDWTLVDVDGSATYGMQGIEWPNNYSAFAFMVFNSEETNPPLIPTGAEDWSARSGDKCMTSFAAVEGPNNDWLISPEITLGSSGNLLSFWAKATDIQYADETFNVGVSVGSTDPNDFNFIQENMTPEAVEWEEFTFDLDNYAGQSVYIAINHTSDDQWGFQIDDFKVTAGSLSVEDMAFQGFNHYTVNNTLYLEANQNLNKISMFNTLGQQVLNRNLDTASTTVNLSQFQTGIYIAKVTIEGAEKSFRVMVK